MDRKLITDKMIIDEGKRAHVYDDATGKPVGAGDTLIGNPTIGVGRNLAGLGVSDAEIEYLLNGDIDRCLAELRIVLPGFNKINTVRQYALLNMMFHLGLPRFRGFRKMIAAVNAAQWETAAAEMMDSHAARSFPGRYNRLNPLMKTGKWIT